MTMKPLDLSEHAIWKERFRVHSIIWARLAKGNPARGIVCSNQTGVMQLYAWEVGTGKLTQITDTPTGKLFGVVGAKGDYIYYLDDKGGNEVGHWVRVPFEGGAPEDITPELPPYASFQLSESPAGDLIGLLTAGAEGFTYYIIEKAADGTLSAPRQLWASKALSGSIQFSADSTLAVIPTTQRTGKVAYDLIVLDVKTGEQINYLAEDSASVNPVRFAPRAGDSRLLAVSDISGYNRPLLWDARTGDRQDIPVGDLGGDISPWDWSPDGETILLCQLNRAEYQLYTYHLPSGALQALSHPQGVVGGFFGGQYNDQGEIVLTFQNSVTPSQLIVLDGQTGVQKRVLLAADTPPAGLPMRSVTFLSDGVEIQAWLGTPPGEGPFPLVIEMHGGPTAVETDVYAPNLQAWLDHGFAVMSVNYRGSTTFGRDFERAIWGKLGTVEVDDIAAARQWAVDQGIAQADSVLITGWSYGGYLTLQTIGKRPDLWAGGMAGIAIADWTLMYEDQAETLRGYQRALFGGSPEEKPEEHRLSSPITYAEAVRAPVLVIQGSNDTRCPARQMIKYEEKMRSLGKDIQIHWFEAGHGSLSVEQRIEHQELMLRFAYRVLG
jgi:dipeptidyl aminopeptidase/acylaminoacyl peptidase